MLKLIGRKIDIFSKNGAISNALYISAIIFFLFFIFLPAIFVLSMGTKIEINRQVIDALSASFQIALIATSLSLLFGIPMAWMISRSGGMKKEMLNTFVDMPLILPTAALGFSVYLFWGSQYGLAILEKGFWMIAALHTAFVFPYVVRTVSAAFEELDLAYETAARSLGANILTVFRTVSFPLVKSAVIIGAMLAFTHSLCETGATMMVAGAVSTAPILVLNFKNAGDMPAAASTSIILIISAVAFLFMAKYLARRASFSLDGVSPRLEARLSRLGFIRDGAVLGFFFLLILIPAFFLFIFLLQPRELPPQEQIGLIIGSLGTSFLVATIVTLVNLVFGFAMAMLIGRNKWGLGKLFESANEVVLVVPTSALGFSLALYWSGLQLPELLVIILAHLSFTYPFVVTPIAAAVSQIDKNLCEAASTLGANPFRVLRTITFPLILPSVLAGVVMAFMRSISETGATLAVARNVSTVPVLIVNLVKSNDLYEAAIACTILFAVSFVFLVIMRRGAKHA